MNNPSSVFIPSTPGGTLLAHLESATEAQAWKALMKDAAHMPYPDKAAFIERGYTVSEYARTVAKSKPA